MDAQFQMVDVHCHLEQHEFNDDRYEVINKSLQRGIAIISSAITKETWELLLQIASQYQNVYASIGLDPMQTADAPEALSLIRKHISKIVSIGEVGLDHFRERDHAERDKQEKVFCEMIQLARELEIPIQVHSRSAGKASLEVLERNDARDVHMHAFDGKANLARVASNDLGYYFSIPTSVVRSPQKQKLVKAVNIERLLIETDSPVLAPEKGERNTPLNLPIVIQEISAILRRDEEELKEIILENTLRLYRRL